MALGLRTDDYTNELVKNMVKSLTDFEVNAESNVCDPKYRNYVECYPLEGYESAGVNVIIKNIPTNKESRTFFTDFKGNFRKVALIQSITIHDANGVIQDSTDNLVNHNYGVLHTIDVRAKGVRGGKEWPLPALRRITIHAKLTRSIKHPTNEIEHLDLAENEFFIFNAAFFLGVNYLNLSHNAITTFGGLWPTSSPKRKYITVDISGNRGAKIFPHIMDAPDLEFLNASGCEFYEKFTSELPEYLSVVDISDNKMWGTLSIPPLALFLNASHNGFTALHYKNSELIPKIESLDLSSNPDLEATFLISEISTPSLEVLNVSNVKSVKFTDLPEGVALPRFPSTLRVLDLTNAGLKGTIPEDAFVDCNRLQRVELSGNNFEGCLPASWKDNAVLKATNLLNTMKYCEEGGIDSSSHIVDSSSHIVDSSSHIVDSSSHIDDSSSHIVDSSSYFDDSSFHDNDSSARSGSNGKTIGIAVGCSLGGVLLLVLLLVVLCCCFRSCCLTQCLIRFWNKVFCCCRCGVTEEGGNARYSLDGEEKSRESRAETVTNSSLTSADFAGFFVNENEDTDNNDAPYSIG